MSDSGVFENRHPDPAFEPQNGFMFEDGQPGEDELQTMQQNIAALNMLKHGAGSNQQQFIDPEFFNQNGRNFENSSSQPGFPNGRAPSVVQQFGQITPPDDSTPEYATSTMTRNKLAASSAEPSSNAKSERARNAANQRHAKAKKARKDSTRHSDDGEGIAEEGEDKRERYREKNRLAAAKCRSKKKNHTENLEESARHITAQNSKLRAEERELRDLFSTLRHQALAHDPTQGCQCKAIHMYNSNKAQEAARGAALGFASYARPSPSLDSGNSAVNSPNFEAASRAHSFSGAGARPLLGAKHTARAHSIASPLGFMPTATGGDPMESPVTADFGQSFFPAIQETMSPHDDMDFDGQQYQFQ